MKRIKLLFVKALIAAVVVAGAVASPLLAQSNLEITASVPFPFIVGTMSIPPGNYQFSLMGSPFLLSVLNVETGRQKLLPVSPGSRQAFDSNGCLVFRNSNGSIVLAEIHFPSTDAFTVVNGAHGIRGSQARLCSKGESKSQQSSVIAH